MEAGEGAQLEPPHVPGGGKRHCCKSWGTRPLASAMGREAADPFCGQGLQKTVKAGMLQHKGTLLVQQPHSQFRSQQMPLIKTFLHTDFLLTFQVSMAQVGLLLLKAALAELFSPQVTVKRERGLLWGLGCRHPAKKKQLGFRYVYPSIFESVTIRFFICWCKYVIF